MAASVAAGAGQLLLKLGADGRHHFTEFINPHIVTGLTCYAIGTALWIYVLSFEKLVNVYAFTALTFVLVYLGDIVLLGQRITLAAISGVLLILAGLFVLTRFNV